MLLLQVCRVEDILVIGIIKGSVVHIHRARTIIVDTKGTITASELGNNLDSCLSNDLIFFFPDLMVILAILFQFVSYFSIMRPYV